jgi:hypothetical protein
LTVVAQASIDGPQPIIGLDLESTVLNGLGQGYGPLPSHQGAVMVALVGEVLGPGR